MDSEDEDESLELELELVDTRRRLFLVFRTGDDRFRFGLRTGGLVGGDIGFVAVPAGTFKTAPLVIFAPSLLGEIDSTDGNEGDLPGVSVERRRWRSNRCFLNGGETDLVSDILRARTPRSLEGVGVRAAGGEEVSSGIAWPRIAMRGGETALSFDELRLVASKTTGGDGTRTLGEART